MGPTPYLRPLLGPLVCYTLTGTQKSIYRIFFPKVFCIFQKVNRSSQSNPENRSPFSEKKLKKRFVFWASATHPCPAALVAELQQQQNSSKPLRRSTPSSVQSTLCVRSCTRSGGAMPRPFLELDSALGQILLGYSFRAKHTLRVFLFLVASMMMRQKYDGEAFFYAPVLDDVVREESFFFFCAVCCFESQGASSFFLFSKQLRRQETRPSKL